MEIKLVSNEVCTSIKQLAGSRIQYIDIGTPIGLLKGILLPSLKSESWHKNMAVVAIEDVEALLGETAI